MADFIEFLFLTLWFDLPYVAVAVLIGIIVYAVFPRRKRQPESRPFDPHDVVAQMKAIEKESLPASSDDPHEQTSSLRALEFHRAMHTRRLSAATKSSIALRGVVFGITALAAVTFPLWLEQRQVVPMVLAVLGTAGGALLIGKLVRHTNRRHDSRLKKLPPDNP